MTFEQEISLSERYTGVLAEREGFDYRHFLQIVVKTRHGDNIPYLRTLQAHS
jgi:hypothetical protein